MLPRLVVYGSGLMIRGQGRIGEVSPAFDPSSGSHGLALLATLGALVASGFYRNSLAHSLSWNTWALLVAFIRFVWGGILHNRAPSQIVHAH